MLTAQGNLSVALTEHEANAAISGAPRRGPPGRCRPTAMFLFSTYAVAHHPAQSKERAEHYMRACLRVLRLMKAEGMTMEPPFVALLEELERSFADA